MVGLAPPLAGARVVRVDLLTNRPPPGGVGSASTDEGVDVVAADQRVGAHSSVESISPSTAVEKVAAPGSSQDVLTLSLIHI